MAVSLRWLLGRSDLGLKLLSPETAVGEVDIVVTTELVDPTPWLSGGEMVLTTGLGTAGQDVDAYVERLAARGVAVLGFGVGFSSEDVPAALVTACAEHGLPLLEVPLPTPFVAIVRAVADRTAELSHRSMQAAAEAQPRMTRAAVSGGPSAVLRELAAACSGAALLTDETGAVLASHPAGIAADTVRQVTEQVRQMRQRGDRAGSFVTHLSEGAVVTQELRVAGRSHGCLAVVTGHRVGPTDRVLIGHANSLLTLNLERSAPSTDAALNAAALGLLLGGSAEKSAASELLGGVVDASGKVRIVSLLGPADSLPELRGHLERRLAAADRPVVVAAVDDAECVVMIGGGDEVSTVQALLSGLPRPVRRRVRTGVSRAVALGDVAPAAGQARAAAQSGRPGGPPQAVNDLTGRTLLTMPEARDALNELALRVVEPLSRYDREHGTALVESLQAYLECHGHWESAGAAIGVHRHTLRARIARAEEILGVDLQSATVRAELLLALLAR